MLFSQKAAAELSVEPSDVLVSTEREARAWVARYDSLGYRQIKVYNVTHPDLIPTIVEDNVSIRCDGCLEVIDGTPWRMNILDVVAARDITVQREVQEAVRLLNQQLELRVSSTVAPPSASAGTRLKSITLRTGPSHEIARSGSSR